MATTIFKRTACRRHRNRIILSKYRKGVVKMAKQELLVDFIISLDGYAAAKGWPGYWGLEGPEYLSWLEQQPERDYPILMGANTYRLMYGFATQVGASELRSEEETSVNALTNASK